MQCLFLPDPTVLCFKLTLTLKVQGLSQRPEPPSKHESPTSIPHPYGHTHTCTHTQVQLQDPPLSGDPGSPPKFLVTLSCSPRAEFGEISGLEQMNELSGQCSGVADFCGPAPRLVPYLKQTEASPRTQGTFAPLP